MSNLLTEIKNLRKQLQDIGMPVREIETLFGNGRANVEFQSLSAAKSFLSATKDLGVGGHTWTCEGSHGWEDSYFALISIVDGAE